MLMRFSVISPSNQDIAPFTGVYIRGFILNLLKRGNIKRNIHDLRDVRPYAIKPLYSKSRKTVKNGRWILREGQELFFEVGVIDPELENEIIKILITNIPEELTIEKARFIINRIDITKRTFGEFIQDNRLGLIGIEFKTPTAFSNKPIPYLFPDVERLFSNLINMWNKFAPNEYKINKTEFLDWAKRNVYLRSYSLKTREVPIKGTKIVGFKGKATYRILNIEDKNQSIAIALLKIGKIINVGIKGSFGLGAIRLVDPKSRQEIEI